MAKKYLLMGLLLSFVLFGLLSSCTRNPTTLTTTTTTTVYSVPELKYLLIANFGGVFYCDPDFYPVGRPEVEQQKALEQFSAIRADQPEFSAILKQLNLPNKTDYSLDEKVLIYREHKKLTLGVELTGSVSSYDFTMRVGENQGYRYTGTVTSAGKITVLKKETSFNTCPICLPIGTLIDTPNGFILVENLVQGMSVWTIDKTGNRIEAKVIKIAKTLVPIPFQMVKVSLDDGRTITASPGHPSATGIALGDYKVSDTLDGAKVIATEYVLYDGLATYDILPSGSTGRYWADGVLLGSTLH
jgi:hypothetical protein